MLCLYSEPSPGEKSPFGKLLPWDALGGIPARSLSAAHLDPTPAAPHMYIPNLSVVQSSQPSF